jgi:hypothetical protein
MEFKRKVVGSFTAPPIISQEQPYTIRLAPVQKVTADDGPDFNSCAISKISFFAF